MTRTIVQVTNDEGLVGLGECSGSAPSKLLNSSLGAQLIGSDTTDIAGWRKICRIDFSDYLSLATPDTVQAFAAVEMALWDLGGKRAGKPVYELLGGAVRQRADYVSYGYLFELNSAGLAEAELPAAMARLAAESVARSGARMFEFKIGRYSVDTDVEVVRAIRAAVGDDVELAVDANLKFDIETARRFLSAVRPQRLAGIEEPVPLYAEMSRLSDEFDLPISAHCIDPEKRMHYPKVIGVVGDLHLQGGLSGTPRQAAAFHSLGLRFWQRACLETGVSWAAMVHFDVACPHVGRASQALMDYIEDDLIEGEPWHVRDGGVMPPSRPGLGVELDLAALEKYHDHYLQRGDYSHFDLR